MERAPGHRTLLGVAAESVASRSQRHETVVDVIHGRAQQHYGEGLRQYLSICLARVDAGRKAAQQVRALAASQGADAMAQHPGIRARLFRMAREVARGLIQAGEVVGDRRALPWRHLPTGASDTRIAALANLRTGLEDAKAELLELRFTRGLPVEEVAFVVDRPLDIVKETLAAAEREAHAILGPAASDAEVFSRSVLEAFSLEKDEPAPAEGSSTEEPSLVDGIVLGGRYRIQKCVGSGSFADVYRASDTSVPGHTVAVKLLHQPSLTDEARTASLRELHLIASVFHPSIVQFKDHGWHESRLWFVMPWYDGESLEARMHREPLSRAEARRIFEPLARALATMHASGLRHQDVKPDNIFLARIKRYDEAETEELLPVLLDLGVAAKDAEMVIAGTPQYFAPEVAAQFAAQPSGREVTNKADVFALALALRNALEPDSEEDLPGGAVEAFIENRAKHIPPMPVSKELAYLRPHFERWLQFDPDLRPTAGQLAQELAVLIEPEAKRARRIATLKWLVPITIGALAAFGSAVFGLQKQAQFQKMQAHAARLETAEVRANLSEANEHGRELETNIATIRKRYENSRFTNQELTTKLAETEGSLNGTREDLTRTRSRARDLDEQLKASQKTSADLNDTLSRTRGQLESTQTAYAAEQAESARVRRDLTQAREETKIALERVNDLNRELTRARADLTVARDEHRDLERDMKRVQAEKDNAEAELVVARRRIATLERQLASSEPKIPEGPRVPAQPGNP